MGVPGVPAMDGSQSRGNASPRQWHLALLRAMFRRFPFPLEGDGQFPSHGPSLPLTVVLPTHARPGGEASVPPLEVCLSSLAEQGVPWDAFEVFVVEDGPLSPRVGEIIQAFEALLPVRHIPGDMRHRPVGWLRNLGLERARGQWILIMDDDALLAPGFLPTFFGMKGQVDPERDIILPRGVAQFCLLNPRYDFFKEYSLGTGCILYPRSLLSRVRGFHSSLLCIEDIDLAIRALLAGGQIHKAPPLQYYHPPLYFPLRDPRTKRRAQRYAEDYRALKQVYSVPFWITFVMREVVELPYLLLPASRAQRIGAVLALYTLRELLLPARRSS